MGEDGDREDWLIEPSSDGDDRDAEAEFDAGHGGGPGDDPGPVRGFDERLSPDQPQDGVPPPRSGARWVFWFVLAVGAALLVSGIGIGFTTWRFLQTAESADGVVVELVERRRREDGRERITYAPRVEFTSAAGETGVFLSSAYSRPPSHEVGESVAVLYDPNDIDRARIDSTIRLWVLPVIFTVVGLIVLSLTIVLVRRTRQPRDTGDAGATSLFDG